VELMGSMCAFVVDDTPTNRVILNLLLGATHRGILSVGDGETVGASSGCLRTELVLIDMQTRLEAGHEGGVTPALRPALDLAGMIREVIGESRRAPHQRPPLAS
jgi:CheY-like chemotaxis protein